MKWALDDPARFLHERSELERLVKEVDWLTIAWGLDNQFSIKVDLDLKIHDQIYEGTLTYPDLFPETPPYIRPRDPSQRWSGHEYGEGGALCLEWRADNWNRSITGADMVRSAYKLLHTERDPAQPAAMVPSAHRLTSGQATRGNSFRLVCTPELLMTLASLSSPNTVQLETRILLHSGATMVAFISGVGEHGQPPQDIVDLPAGISSYLPLFAWKEDGLALKSDAFDQKLEISTVEHLRTAISQAGFLDEFSLVREPDSQKYKNQFVLLLGTELRSMRAFAIQSGEEPTLGEYNVILPEEHPRRLPEEHAKLGKLRIGIVGLGSLGSKIVISIARSGVLKFLLVDDDLLVPGNLSRHELSWSSVGLHKVDALREALSLIAPGIIADVRSHRVAGQESALAAAAALKDLGSCDVLIDASACANVFLLLAAVAKANRRALCWGELFAGGFGGLIARARPGIDPNPLAVRAAILSHCESLPTAPYQQATGYDGQAEEPFVAHDGQVGQIASALTTFVLDTALDRDPSEFPYSAYLIGLRKEWIFSQPFDTHPIEVHGQGWESDSDPAITEETRSKVIEELLEIIFAGKHVDA
jgi:molybdopterin/thiamine biosynthesis adenylyltransferase